MNIFFHLEEENNVAQLLSLQLIGGKKIISFARRKMNIFKEKLSPVVLNRIQNFPKNEIMLLARDLIIQYLKDEDSKVSYYLNLFETIIINHSKYTLSFFHRILTFIYENDIRSLDFIVLIHKEKIPSFKEYTPTMLRHLVKYVNKEQIKAHISFCWTPQVISIFSALRAASIMIMDGKISKESSFQVTDIFNEISDFLAV